MQLATLGQVLDAHEAALSACGLPDPDPGGVVARGRALLLQCRAHNLIGGLLYRNQAAFLPSDAGRVVGVLTLMRDAGSVPLLPEVGCRPVLRLGWCRSVVTRTWL